MMNKRSPGRPRGTSRTRDAIREAARVRFGRVGYRHATLRAIAEDAGVDSALIHYYFGSKRELLAEVLALPANPATLLRERLALPLDRLPYAVLSAVVAAWESPEGRPSLFAQLVSIDQDDAATPLVRDFIQYELASPLAQRLEDDGVSPAEAGHAPARSSRRSSAWCSLATCSRSGRSPKHGRRTSSRRSRRR